MGTPPPPAPLAQTRPPWVGVGSDIWEIDVKGLEWVRTRLRAPIQREIHWLNGVQWGKRPGLGGILRISPERKKISTSSHLILNRTPSTHVRANFRGERRYENVQGHIVGAVCTVPRAQVQTGRGVRVSYYMKGKSEWTV